MNSKDCIKKMSATVVLSGIRYTSSISLEDLGFYFDKVFDTNDIGTFTVRDLRNRKHFSKYQIAIDFHSGYDAMYAQKILDGKSYRMSDGVVNVLRAKVTHDPELMPKPPPIEDPPWKCILESTGITEDESKLVNKQLVKARDKIDAKLHFLNVKKTVILTEEEELLLEREKLKKELEELCESDESPQTKLYDSISSASDEPKPKRVRRKKATRRSQKTSCTVSHKMSLEPYKSTKNGRSKSRERHSNFSRDDHSMSKERYYYFGSRSTSERRSRSQSSHSRSSYTRSSYRRSPYTRSPDRRSRSRLESRRGCDEIERYSRNNSMRGVIGYNSNKSVTSYRDDRQVFSQTPKITEIDEPKVHDQSKTIAKELKERNKELKSKRNEAVKEILNDLQKTLIELCTKHKIPSSDKSILVGKLSNKIDNRMKTLKLTSVMTVSDLVMHYRWKYSKIEDNEMVAKMFNNFTSIKTEDTELTLDSNVDEMWSVIDTVFQDCDLNSFTEDTEVKAEVLSSEEKEEEKTITKSITNITVHIIPTPTEKSIDNEKQDEGIDKEKQYEGIYNEEQNEGIENNSLINITVDPNRRKKYCVTINDLMRKLKKHMFQYNHYIEYNLFEYVIRGVMEKRIDELLVGRDYIRGKDLVKLYREYYPQSLDETFVGNTFNEIWNGLYNDVEPQTHPPQITPATVKLKSETTENEAGL